MFDELLRELRRMPKSFKVPVDLPIDEKGYLDRRCSMQECRSYFKVLETDWLIKVKDKAAFCPRCGGPSPADTFNTDAQKRYISDVAKKFAADQIDSMMKKAVRRTRPRRIDGGLISIDLNLKYRSHRIPTPLAQRASEALRQDFVCQECECQYSTIGAGYFCPACGHNSAEQDFSQTIETTLKAVELLDQIKATIVENADSDFAENIYNQMIEDQVENLVTALQRVTESMYGKLPGTATAPFNIFQRLDDASKLWGAAIGCGYEDILDSREYAYLGKMLQHRHKLGHAQGMVDDRYVEKSGDTSYRVGQRLVTKASDVKELARVVQKLVTGIKARAGA